MKSTNIVGTCLAAVFACSALAVASASATPEFIPQGTAKFPIPVTGGNKATLLGEKPTLEGNGSAVSCTSDTDTSELTAAMEVKKAVIVFKGCKDGTFSCGISGTVTTKSLGGILTLSNGGKVGLLLKSEAGTVFAEFKCSILTITVTGSVIGELLEVTKTSSSLIFKAAGGVQELTEFTLLGGVKETAKLEAFGGSATEMAEDSLSTGTKEVKLEP